MSRGNGAAGGGHKAFQHLETPWKVFNAMNAIFHFTVDGAASASNAKLERYWDEEADSLKQAWHYQRVFCNPEFEMKELFLAKAETSRWASPSPNHLSVLLLPNSTETEWFQKWSRKADRVLLPPGRIQYELKGEVPKRWDEKNQRWVKSSNTKGSALFIFGAEWHSKGNSHLNIEVMKIW